MRVYVKEDTGQKIDIRIPTGLALNRVTAGIVAKVMQKNGVEITKNQMKMLVKAVKDYKKHHPDWKLVEIQDADGEQVEIVL